MSSWLFGSGPIIGGPGNDIHRSPRPVMPIYPRSMPRKEMRADKARVHKAQKTWDDQYDPLPRRGKVLIGGPGNDIHGPKQMSTMRRIRKFQNRNLLVAGMGGAVVFGGYELAKHHSSGRNGVQPQSSGGYSGM